MKNILTVFISLFIICLGGCAGFFLRSPGDIYHNDQYFHNKHSYYNPYYGPYDNYNITIVPPVSYGHSGIYYYNNHLYKPHCKDNKPKPKHKHNHNHNKHYVNRNK